MRIFVGRFITFERERPEVEAIAVRGEEIVATGGFRSMQAAAGARAEVIEVPGVALPGLVDAHIHIESIGEALEQLDLRGLDRDQIVAAVARQADMLPPGSWIRGGGWDESLFAPASFPTAADLDPIARHHPVLLTRIDHHAAWANSRALATAGIGGTPADPPAGRWVRDATGLPTGVAIDAAMAPLVAAMPVPTPEVRRERIRLALARCAGWGLTAVHDAGIDADTLELYYKLGREGPLPTRVYAMAKAPGALANDLVDRGPRATKHQITVRSIKLFRDGALGSRGARLTTPYADAPGETGIDLIESGELMEWVLRAAESGIQVATHAIGDLAIRDVLDAYETVGQAAKGLRFRIEHASVLDPKDLSRFAELGVIASIQPVFISEYARWAADRVGPARLPWVYATKDLIASGAPIAVGSDFPASESGDPRATLYALVARRGTDEEPAGGWQPSQAIDRLAALRMMAWGSAFASFTERTAGALGPGRIADFTAFTSDPRAGTAEQLLDLEVSMTVVGGGIRYRAL